MAMGKKGDKLMPKRKKFRYIFIVLLICTGSTVCMYGDDTDANKNYDDFYNEFKQFLLPTKSSSNLIPDEERVEVMMNAVEGDGLAARRLESHFFTGRGDYNTGVFWLTIGAENDHSEAQYGLANALLNGIDKDLQKRGIFWLYKIAVIGYRDSVELLERVGYSLDTAQPPNDELFSFRYTTYITITREQISQCKDGALKGNGTAALILARYYNEVARDTVSAEYWYKTGAQNGNNECQYQYGRILNRKQDIPDQKRGMFWTDRSGRNGL